ncbi:32221_t:CDS:2, partial [Racocetra persica]
LSSYIGAVFVGVIALGISLFRCFRRRILMPYPCRYLSNGYLDVSKWAAGLTVEIRARLE